jgi:hypothetical protein
VGMTSDEGVPEPAGVEGVSGEDLPLIRRELLLGALEVARREHDPVVEWEGFCAVVWREAALAFGFVERPAWPAGLALPSSPGWGQGEGEAWV